MDWAAWEGMTIDELRAEIGNPGEAWRAGGLDFKAPGGESQRDVQTRLLSFFAEVACQSANRNCLSSRHRSRDLFARGRLGSIDTLARHARRRLRSSLSISR